MGYAKKISIHALFILLFFSSVCYFWVHSSIKGNDWYKYKIRAAALMARIQDLLKERAKDLKLEISKADDPNETGLIGPEQTPITTEVGVLDVKRMATNPNLAIVAVDLFKKVGLKKGDTIAIGYSGSLVGANLAVLCAAEAMGLQPILITSLGSSSYGATNSTFTWLDMENHIFQKGLVHFRSVAASLGGNRDIAQDLTEEGVALLKEAIGRNQVLFIYEPNIDKNVEARMNIYKSYAKGPVKAYINVGGGHVSLGISSENERFMPTGIITEKDSATVTYGGVIAEMLSDGIPVINFLRLRELMLEYELPPFPVPLPKPGKGSIDFHEEYNLMVVIAAIFLLFVAIITIVELDLFIIPKYRDRLKMVFKNK
jgi:poly-gamma-glutamate system protein